MELPPGSEPSTARHRDVLHAARRCFADRRPSDVTLAEVAAAAGTDESTVVAMFRSKRGLERAVVEDFAQAYRVPDTWSERFEPAFFATVFAERRRDRVGTRLLVRCALGDLDVAPLLQPGNFWAALVQAIDRQRGRKRGAVPMRTRMIAFGALSMLVGWFTYEPFLTRGLGLHERDPVAVDDAVAEFIRAIAAISLQDDPKLVQGFQSPSRSGPVHSDELPAGDRGIGETTNSRIDEFVDRATHHFDGGSRFDLAQLVRVVRHDSPVASDLARAVVSGVSVDEFRTEFPILDAILGAYRAQGHLAPPVGGEDRPLAVGVGIAMVLGSALWDRPLRQAVGIRDDTDLDPVMATLARTVAGFDDPTRPLGDT